VPPTRSQRLLDSFTAATLSLIGHGHRRDRSDNEFHLLGRGASVSRRAQPRRRTARASVVGNRANSPFFNDGVDWATTPHQNRRDILQTQTSAARATGGTQIDAGPLKLATPTGSRRSQTFHDQRGTPTSWTRLVRRPTIPRAHANSDGNVRQVHGESAGLQRHARSRALKRQHAHRQNWAPTSRLITRLASRSARHVSCTRSVRPSQHGSGAGTVRSEPSARRRRLFAHEGGRWARCVFNRRQQADRRLTVSGGHAVTVIHRDLRSHRAIAVNGGPARPPEQLRCSGFAQQNRSGGARSILAPEKFSHSIKSAAPPRRTLGGRRGLTFTGAGLRHMSAA